MITYVHTFISIQITIKIVIYVDYRVMIHGDSWRLRVINRTCDDVWCNVMIVGQSWGFIGLMVGSYGVSSPTGSRGNCFG